MMQSIGSMRQLPLVALTLLAASPSHAQTVRFCDDRSAFEAAAGDLSLVNFEGVAPPGGVVSMPSYATLGAVFASSLGLGNLTLADADNNDTLGAPYASDLVLVNLISDSLRISFPPGTTAIGGQFGSIAGITDVRFTLEAATGVLADMYATDAPGFNLRGQPRFFGWIVEGADVTSLTISGSFEAADNVLFGSAGPAGSACLRPRALAPGDVVVADVGIQGLIHVEAESGAQRIITRRGFLHDPAGVIFDKDGSILVADYFYDNQEDGYFGRIVRVEPSTGMQTLVAIGGLLRGPTGLALDAAGSLIVADAFGVQLVRINLDTGEQRVISSGDFFVFPTSLAIDPQGTIYVADQNALGGIGGIIRVDPDTGRQEAIVICTFADPAGIVMDSRGDLLVADSTGAPGSFDGAIARVNPDTGNALLVSIGDFLGQPWGIARETGGDLVVSIMGGAQKGVIRVDPITGEQTMISLGGEFIRPFGVAVVPDITSSECDINGDGQTNSEDLAAFVLALLGTPLESDHVARSDLNHDGVTNGQDVPLFIECIDSIG